MNIDGRIHFHCWCTARPFQTHLTRITDKQLESGQHTLMINGISMISISKTDAIPLKAKFGVFLLLYTFVTDFCVIMHIILIKVFLSSYRIHQIIRNSMQILYFHVLHSWAQIYFGWNQLINTKTSYIIHTLTNTYMYKVECCYNAIQYCKILQK